MNPVSRRGLLEWAVGSAAVGMCAGSGEAASGCRAQSTLGKTLARPPRTVRDALWIWTHPAGAHNTSPKEVWPHADYGIPKELQSRMTAAEGALYMGIPNVIHVRYLGRPGSPYYQYALALSPFKRVVWSITGAAGQTEGEKEVTEALELLAQFPGFVGVIMDDFFRERGEKVAVWTLEELRRTKARLGRSELWVTLYASLLSNPGRIDAYLQLVDVITFWTWTGAELERLEANFASLEKAAPAAGKVLGCYMWDYGARKPMPVSLMRRQCDLGLSWLKAGRIDGMIFLSQNLCDLGLETVEWTRRWIEEVGDQPV